MLGGALVQQTTQIVRRSLEKQDLSSISTKQLYNDIDKHWDVFFVIRSPQIEICAQMSHDNRTY